MRVSSGVQAASSPLTITAGGRQVSILLMICCVEDGDVDCAWRGIVMRIADAANNFTAERGSIIRISRHFFNYASDYRRFRCMPKERSGASAHARRTRVTTIHNSWLRRVFGA